MSEEYKFSATPWGNTDLKIMLEIYQARVNRINPDMPTIYKLDIIDKNFGNIDIRENVYKFKVNGKIVGYCGLTNMNGDRKSWGIVYPIPPEYLDTSLPELVVDTCISLAKRSKEPRILFSTKIHENPFDIHLKNRGYSPIHFQWGMVTTEIQTMQIPIAPKSPAGITFNIVEDIEDYSEFAYVRNTTFRDFFDHKKNSAEEDKARIDYQRRYFTIGILLAYDEETLIGFGWFAMDRKSKICYGRELAVLPEYHNHSIGSTIIQKVLEFLKSEGIKEWRFHVYGENKNALRLYKRFGFKELEKTSFKTYNLK